MQARQCLSGNRIAFVGDSISRYHYLHLSHILGKGKYPERYGGHPDVDGPSMCIEREWGSWAQYFAETRQLMSNSPDATAFESCDCHRPDNMWRLRENWEFSLSNFNSSDRPSSLSLSFYFLGPRYEDAVTIVNRAVQSFGPSSIHDGGAVLFSYGAWGPLKPEFAEAQLEEYIAPVFQQVAKELPELAHQPLRLFWKTVTSTTNAKYEPLLERLDAGAKAAAAPLFEVYDVRTLTEQLKRQSLRLLHDGTHFLCVAYEQINDLLLNTLCDSDLSFHSG